MPPSRPAPLVPSPPPAAYQRLKQAWDAGVGGEAALSGIDWDTPVFAWRSQEKGERAGHLVHPLAMVFELGDPHLARAVADRMRDHAWPNQTLTQEQAGSSVPLPHMGALWEWGVIQAALAARAWDAANLLVPRVMANIAHMRYPSVASVALCAQLGRVDDLPAAQALWDALANLAPSTRTRDFWATLVLATACAEGHPQLALDLATSLPALVPTHKDLATLVGRGHVDHALALARLAAARDPRFVEHEDMEEWTSQLVAQCHQSPSPQTAAATLWVLERWPHARGCLTDPQYECEGSVNLRPAAQVAAHLLALLPPGAADPLLAQSRGVVLGVVQAWLVNDLGDAPALAPWLEQHARLAPTSIRKQMLQVAFGHFVAARSAWEGDLAAAQALTSPAGPLASPGLARIATQALAARVEHWAGKLGLSLVDADDPQVLDGIAQRVGPGLWETVCLERVLPPPAPAPARARM